MKRTNIEGQNGSLAECLYNYMIYNIIFFKKYAKAQAAALAGTPARSGVVSSA
jgi:hypothetical protein